MNNNLSESNKPVIDLMYIGGLGLIIIGKSNVVYSNQTGGYSCLDSNAEGWLVPLDDVGFGLENELYKYFTGPKWNGCCDKGIDNEDADKIDEILNLYGHTQFIKVNRSKLSASHEAWVHVRTNYD